MRSGNRQGGNLKIGISKLTTEDTQRLINVLNTKLGLTSTVSANNRYLIIHDITK
jgi:hypothetical protein